MKLRVDSGSKLKSLDSQVSGVSCRFLKHRIRLVSERYNSDNFVYNGLLF